ncbi:hypothetical protein L873DRAFT_1823289 [Choiromyces venosus 120613-1]|uniref:Uncharacterized protein n=1 Tax=Choiromyces venosus 120613-1 TaxID=1336337 RepID=A0A3N4IY12_9PEZI|nr:hypothetical protein L873DRAFT_1823289 [Choiromyces venosus 120613-1]
MSSISSSPVPWQVAETVTDLAREHNSTNDSGSITNFHDTFYAYGRESCLMVEPLGERASTVVCKK